MKFNHSDLTSSQFPSLLYTAAQVRELDRVAIEEFNDPGISLMEHAGNAVFNALCLRRPRTRRIAVICGGGNNGGDGYVVARLAVSAGIRVVIYQLGDVQRLQGDALTAYERLEGTRVEMHAYDGQPLEEMDVIVDAMLGTGLNGEVTGVWRLAIEAVNTAAQQGSYIVACDIPSGLHADTGSVLGCAVNADLGALHAVAVFELGVYGAKIVLVRRQDRLQLFQFCIGARKGGLVGSDFLGRLFNLLIFKANIFPDGRQP